MQPTVVAMEGPRLSVITTALYVCLIDKPSPPNCEGTVLYYRSSI